MRSKTILFEKKQLHEVPALLAYEHSIEQASQNGTILLLHGLGFHKDGHKKELEQLAQAGFLAIGLDAPEHGERRNPELQKLMQNEEDILAMISRGAAEIEGVIDDLLSESLIEDVRLGVLGVSMGAMTVYKALCLEQRIVAGVCLLGTPHFGADSQSPHLQANNMFPAALLSQTAGLDSSVPPDAARDLHQTLAPMYADFPERLRYIEYRYSGHFMRQEDWNTAFFTSIDWLKRFV